MVKVLLKYIVFFLSSVSLVWAQGEKTTLEVTGGTLIVSPVEPASVSLTSEFLRKGTFSISGAVSFSHYWGDESGFYYSLSPTVGYFIRDDMAVGGSVLLYNQETALKTNAVISLGPVFDWYFFKADAGTAFTGASVYVGLTDATTRTIIEARVGYWYFLSPSFALGPEFNLRYYAASGSSWQRAQVHFTVATFF